MDPWDDATSEEDYASDPFRMTPGFIAFIAALLLPALVAIAVYVSAALVADEVRAAEASTAASFSDQSGVEGWKKTLVFVCPLH